MTAITVRATDSHKAMEELLRRLGPDALILSTRRAGGMVEVTATAPDGGVMPSVMADTPAPVLSAPVPPAPAPDGTDPRLQARRANAAPRAAHPRPSPPPIASPFAFTAPGDAGDDPAQDHIPLDQHAPDHRAADVRPAGTVLRQPPRDFAAALRAEAARAMPTDPFTRLARTLLLPEGLDEVIPSRLLIAGPPGSGKSMLAARLAAHWMLADPDLRPRIIAPVPGTLLVEDRLRGWARLMGLTPDRPNVAAAMDLPDPQPTAPQIIDLSDIPADAPALTARLIETDGAELILCLPAGLHPARIARACHDWQAFAPTVTLTGLDLWWPEQGELAAIADAGLRVTRTAAGTGLVHALSRPGPADLRNWAAGWTPAYAGAAE